MIECPKCGDLVGLGTHRCRNQPEPAARRSRVDCPDCGRSVSVPICARGTDNQPATLERAAIQIHKAMAECTVEAE